ncbi:MAG TPA: GNAT family N-acetyltransferase [Steroidobacteraceae bacterium]|nr:GNAT family N-acetyltransferase [Steroidobacteraceae bacterium]
MSRPVVHLVPEVTRTDALAMMDWLKDEEVTRYLSDSRHVSREIEQVVYRVQLPTLTHLFSRGGRFLMACDERKVPIGFVRLVSRGEDYELVIVIGERHKWGRKLGTSALHEALRLAFRELRAGKLIARIHPDNLRSIRAFRNCGFQLESESPALMTFTLARDRYFALSANLAAAVSDIHITVADRRRLQRLITAARGRDDSDERELESLAFEIERAIVLPSRQVSRDVVTMNSRARLRLNEETTEISLVYPKHADGSPGKVSVFSPLGTAILGFREGDLIDWGDPDDSVRIRIEKVLYQPEAAGDFHL